MALMKCPTCGKRISSYADTCPQCGCAISITLKDYSHKGRDDDNNPLEHSQSLMHDNPLKPPPIVKFAKTKPKHGVWVASVMALLLIAFFAYLIHNSISQTQNYVDNIYTEAGIQPTDKPTSTPKVAVTSKPITESKSSVSWNSLATMLGDLAVSSFSEYNPSYWVSKSGVYITVEFPATYKQVISTLKTNDGLTNFGIMKNAYLEATNSAWDACVKQGYGNGYVYCLEMISSDSYMLLRYYNGNCTYDLTKDTSVLGE